MSALMAASASALPEFSAPFSKPFTSTSKKSTLETISGQKLVCKADTNVGEVTGPVTGTIAITFSGCAQGKVACNTLGMPPGEIATSPLTFTMGYINKPKKQVGLDLVPLPGSSFMEFVCGPAVRGIVRGSVIGRIAPVNFKVKPPKYFELHFTQSKGVQKVTKLEASPVDTLETSFGGPFEESGLASTDKITFLEEVEIKA
jgi:hypothetical protein